MRRVFGALIVSALAARSSIVRADDVIHFTNGAEMTVRAHMVEKGMVRLDLGGNSFISFPVSMVDKIVSAGKNVFLNPVYHPSNQALPASTIDLPSPLPDRSIRGGGVPVGYRLGQSRTGTGLRLGEAANEPGPGWDLDSGRVTTYGADAENNSTPYPRKFDVLNPAPPGTRVTIDPPGGSAQTRFQPRALQARANPADAPPPTPPQPEGDGTVQDEAPPQPDEEPPPAQDPPETR